MKAAWDKVSARFDALNKRERHVVFFGAIAAVALVGYQGLVDPHQGRHAVAAKRLAQIAQSQQELRARLASSQAQSRAPDEKIRADLETARQRLAQVDSQFGTVHATLVPPGQMATLVESMLRSDRDLQLVAMTTLPPTPIVAEPRAGASGESGAPPAAGEEPESAALFKHGLRITLRGNYADLLHYLEQLERMPQKMYWGHVVLAAEEYPVSRLQLTVYTISIGKLWLVI
ncbi:MAG TPA: type II secretion system protein GspM [Usitatibacteraceae bacterium]|nr:type II secretion system protein GspM [Usitatibacteraceae bacterium]